MKKIILISLISLCFSCKSVEINRQEAYSKNKEYIKKIYNEDIDNKNAGFYIKKGKFYFTTKGENSVYELEIDSKGDLLNYKEY